jgi:hypothetical protein
MNFTPMLTHRRLVAAIAKLTYYYNNCQNNYYKKHYSCYHHHYSFCYYDSYFPAGLSLPSRDYYLGANFAEQRG